MAVELATGYVSIVPTATGIGGNLSKLLAGPAAAAGTTAGKQAGKGITTGVGSSTSGVGSIIKKNAVLPILGIGVAAFASAKTVEEAQNTVIRSTGATGKVADQLKQSFKNVAGSTPADMKTVADAMSTVYQRTGLTGKALEHLTLQTVTFNRITKDAPVNVADLTKTLAAFNVPAAKMSGQLDDLFKISQKTGVPLNDLIGTLDSAGPIVRQFGIPIGESAALLAQLDKAGISSNQVIPGLRKAMIGFAKDGKEPGVALQQTLDVMGKLIKTGDTLGARKLAVQVFGARGAGIVDAATSGKISIDNLTQSLDKMKGGKGILDTASATGTLAGKFGLLKNQATLALSELGTPVLGAFTDLLKGALPVITGIAHGFADLPGPVKQASAALIALAVLKGPIGKVAGGLKDLGKVGVSGLKGLASGAKATYSGVGRLVGGFKDANVAGSAFSGKLGTLGGKLRSAVSAAGSGAKTFGGWAKSLASVGKDAVVAAAGIVKQTAASVASKAASLAAAAASKVWAAGQWLLNAALDANPISLIVIGIAALVAGIIVAYKNVGWFRDAIDAVWGAIKTVAGFLIDNWPIALAAMTGGMSLVVAFVIDHWNTIVNVVKTAIGFVWNIIQTVVGAIVTFWSAEWNAITTVVSFVWGLITGAVSGGLSLVRSVFDAFVGTFRSAWEGFWGGLTDTVGFAAGAIKSVFNGVVGALKTAWNGIAGAWNSTIGSIHVSVPDWVPVFGGDTFDMPNLPKLANGGIVQARPGGTLAILGERRQDEAVIPLPKLDELGAGAANVDYHPTFVLPDSDPSTIRAVEYANRRSLRAALRAS